MATNNRNDPEPQADSTDSFASEGELTADYKVGYVDGYQGRTPVISREDGPDYHRGYVAGQDAKTKIVNPFPERARFHMKMMKEALLADPRLVIMVMCEDLKTGEEVPVIAVLKPGENGNVGLLPIARVFTGEGVDEVKPSHIDSSNIEIKGRHLNG